MPVLEPNVTLSIIPAQQLAGVQEQKVLIVGQKLAGGTATAGALVSDIQNDNSWDTLFGKRSHIAGMVREFKELNKIVQLDAISLADNGAAVQGTSVAAVTGTATANGRIFVTVGSAFNHRKAVDILVGDTATDVGDAIVAAFATDLEAPFTQANVTGTVTFTAENGGTLCNDWTIAVEGSVAGISIALTGWSGGATDPSLTGIFDVIGNNRYQSIVWPSAYDVTEVETLLNARFNASNLVLDGVALQVKKGTLASLKSYANQNSQSLVVIGNKTVSETDRIGTATQEMPDTMASEIAAFRSLRLTQDALLTQFLTTVSPLDQFGGIAIASLPYFNTLAPNLPVPSAVDEWTLEESGELRDNAISVVGPNRAYNSTILGEFVTTYLTNSAGNPDTSFKFLEVVDTSSVIREFYYENYRSRYAQTRLTQGDLIPGRDMANEASIRAFTNLLYDELAENALVQSGRAAKKDFNDNLSIVIDISEGKATINMAPLLVTQLRSIIGTIQVNFGS